MKLFDPTSKPVERRSSWRRGPRAPGACASGWWRTPSSTRARILREAGRAAGPAPQMTVTVRNRKRSASHEVDEAGIRALRAQADLVISGIGD